MDMVMNMVGHKSGHGLYGHDSRAVGEGWGS